LLEKIKLVASDVDGVLTSSQKTYDMGGNILSKTFSDLDTLGIKLARYFGIRFVIITGDNRINTGFANTHKIDFIHTFKSKYVALREYIETNKLNINDDEVCYLGNDINDLDCLDAFYSIVPSKTTTNEVRRRATTSLFTADPGYNFVRTVLDMILAKKGITLDDKFKALQIINKWGNDDTIT